MECGSSMQRTRFQRPQMLMATPMSSSDLRKHCLS
jgi:hypothetical protein